MRMSRSNDVEFTAWLRERQTMLLRASKAICFDSQNAEDVLQEALGDVYQRWSKLRTHPNIEAYVIRVMVSKHSNLRRKWARRQSENESPFALAESILEIADKSDDVVQRLLVQSALKSLTAIQRAVLVLIYEHGLVLREVAETLEIPIGTIASHLARGKASVAAYLSLVPEFEKSIKMELPSVAASSIHETSILEIVIGEVVEDE